MRIGKQAVMAGALAMIPAVFLAGGGAGAEAQEIAFVSKEVVQPLPAGPAVQTGKSQSTRILSQRDLRRLRTVEGISLQWLSFEGSERGRVSVAPDAAGLWQVSGTQVDESGAGLRVEGTITEIGKNYFLLDGRIQIGNTPDAGRQCDASKVWRFEVTQNRSYYRLREFEWCDGLTDYVDIYFAPSLR